MVVDSTTFVADLERYARQYQNTQVEQSQVQWCGDGWYRRGSGAWNGPYQEWEDATSDLPYNTDWPSPAHW